MRLAIALIIVLIANFSGAFVMADNSRMLGVLATDNHFALMRHALAPGTGDPSTFSVNDCATQRNLNDAGREQATAIGEFLRSHSGLSLNVYSSQWCRCMETAQLLGMGSVTPMPEINSFYANRSIADSQTLATSEWLVAAELPVILVTHQVNITALAGVYPSSGEIIVLKREADGALVVVGSINL